MTAIPHKVICISLYNDSLEDLDTFVKELKAKGVTRANRSSVIRLALNHLYSYYADEITNESLVSGEVK